MTKGKSKAKRVDEAVEDTANYNVAVERFAAEYEEAVRAKDIGVLLKLQYFAQELYTMQRPLLREQLLALGLFESNAAFVDKLRAEWIKTLKPLDTVDVYGPSEWKWFETKILEIDHARGEMKVHYQGWDSKFDEVLPINETMVCPLNTFTKAKAKAVKAIRTVAVVEEVMEQPPVQTAAPENTLAMELSGGAISERASRRRNRTDAHVDSGQEGSNKRPSGSSAAEQPGADGKEGKEKEEKDHNDWVCTVCGWFEAPDGSDLVCCDALCKRSFHLGCMEGVMTAPIGDDRWYCDDCVVGQHLCFICGERGVDNQEVHNCSVATCGKYFHRTCLEKEAALGNILHTKFTPSGKSRQVMKVIAIPKPASAGSGVKSPVKGLAGGAGKVGAPAVTVEAASPRSTRGHRIDYRAVSKGISSPTAENQAANDGAESDDSSSQAGAAELAQQPTKAARVILPENCTFELQKVDIEGGFTFKCPFHSCFNCFHMYGNVDGGDLNQCLACPRSFHTNCIIPGSRYNSMCVLCPRHPDKPLPSHDVRQNPKVMGAKKAAPVNEYSLFWEQLAIPEERPNAQDPHDNHFKLQVHIKDAAEEVPQTFIKITRNDYDTFPEGKPVQGFVPEVACECTVDCGEDCLNRILRIECCDTKIKAAAGEGRGSGDQCICAIGGRCSNRALQNRKYAKTEPFREFQMGWGLRAKEDIAEGDLVMEYVGEVIDGAEVHRRMTAQRQNTPQDKDFYIMELSNGMFVDGKFKGSTSRYINHSCDPNCELQRWVVKGYPRIGIFALRDISAGEALSYDYQFDTNEAETFKCYCGTEKCRGTMAPSKKKQVLFDAQGRPQSKEDRERLILMGKMREQTMGRESAEWSRSYTGKFIPGDPINEMRNGPVKAAVKAARDAHLAIRWNIQRGANFYRRNMLLQRRAEKMQLRTKSAGKRNGTTAPRAPAAAASREAPARVSTAAPVPAAPGTPTATDVSGSPRRSTPGRVARREESEVW